MPEKKTGHFFEAGFVKTLIAVVLSIVMILSLSLPGFAMGNSDTTGDWFKDSMKKAVENGVFQEGLTAMDSTREVSRAEMSAVMNRIFSASESADLTDYSDVPKGSPYASDIAKALKMGVINGENGKIRPMDAITREEAFTILARAFSLHTTDISPLKKFSDSTAIDEWAEPGMAALTAAGYIIGSNDKIYPKDKITLGELAVIIDKLVAAYYKTATTSSSAPTGNIMITAPGTVLKNMTIAGDLIIGDGVGTGVVTIEGVTVSGRIVVRGGGESSIKLINSSVNGKLTVINKVHIAASDNSKVPFIELKTDAILDGTGFGDVTVSSDTGSNTSLNVIGNVNNIGIFTQVSLRLSGGTIDHVLVQPGAGTTTIAVANGSTIGGIRTNARTEITGLGSIRKLEVNAEGIKTEQTPSQTIIAQSVVNGASIAGQTVKPVGDSNKENTSVSFSEIAITPSLNLPVDQVETLMPAIKTAGTESQNIYWYSSDTRVATVSRSGLVTAMSIGTAIILAYSDDGTLSNICTVNVRAKNNQGQFSNSMEYGPDFVVGDPRTDAPELAHRGKFGVGVRTITVTDPAQGQRPLPLEIWYPAVIPSGMKEMTWYTDFTGISSDPNRPVKPFTFVGRALRNAAPDSSAGKLPLVIVSHGFPGTRTMMTNLTENLASKGYVVVAIEHTGNTKFDQRNMADQRPRDDVFVIDCLEAAGKEPGSFLNGVVDASHTALIGYSFGGQGVLRAAGIDDTISSDPRVKALVAFAPYGESKPENEAKLTIPSLTVAGTMDDTANFNTIKTKYNNFVNSDRYFLVYQNGNHEIPVNPPPYTTYSDVYVNSTTRSAVPPQLQDEWQKWREFIYYNEPTWDQQHMNNINQHFVTAFLDLYMKGDKAKRDYLNVPYPISTINSLYGLASPNWKGFQPWTNAGLELYHSDAVKPLIPVYDGKKDLSHTANSMTGFKDTPAIQNFVPPANGYLNSSIYGPNFMFGDPRTDAPELAYRGKYGVGVRTINTINPDQIDIRKFDKASNPKPIYNRPLKMEVWYPAIIPEGKKEVTTYYDTTGMYPDPTRPNVPFERTGRALREASPDISGGKFPLVVLSHGAGGSRLLLSYLGENLASKGYVVVSIEHTGSTKLDNNSVETLLNRPLDDRFAIDTMERMGNTSSSFLSGIVNVDRTAVVGYSMGGYGVLNLTGVGLNPSFVKIPGSFGDDRKRTYPNYAKTLDPRIKSVVAISPWAGSSEEVFDNQSLLGLTLPTLFITGTADQTAPFNNVKRMFEGTRNADRYMLVYQNGDHEVGSSIKPWITYTNVYTNSPVRPESPEEQKIAWQTWRDYMFYYEPVWDNAHTNNINEHFVTAFLDLYLKNDTTKQAFLDVPKPIGNEQALNEWGATGSGWKGFKNYGLSGIELHKRVTGQGGILDFVQTAKTPDTASFSFTAPTGATQVEVVSSIDGGLTWRTANTGKLTAASTTATITGLLPGTVYQFKLRVKEGTYNGESPEVLSAPIIDLKSSKITSTTASLTFGKPIGATSIVLMQSSDNGKKWVPSKTEALTEASTSATVTDLNTGTYQFMLAVTGGSRAGNSNVITVSVQ